LDPEHAADAEVDESTTAHMNTMFLEGEQPTAGEVLMAAILWKWPSFGRYGNRKLPRSWRALRGWRRRAPARSRRPHALAMWWGIAWELCRDGLWIMAVYLVFTLSTYMRPSEPLLILAKDLVAPQRGISKDWHVTLFPEERPARSKTYAVNDSVCLTTSLAPFLPELLVSLLEARQPEDRLFPFTYPSYLEAFEKCRRRLDLPRMVPYQSRHSGPAVDVARGSRTQPEVKDRGRWKSDKSVQRYEQRARLGQSFQQLPPRAKSHLSECEAKLGALLLGRIQADELVWERT